MFPARAGMSRTHVGSVFDITNVPRASGDEPCAQLVEIKDIACSPRERG